MYPGLKLHYIFELRVANLQSICCANFFVKLDVLSLCFHTQTTPRDAPYWVGWSEKINTAIITEEKDTGHVWHDKSQMDISGRPCTVCLCLCVCVCMCDGYVCVCLDPFLLLSASVETWAVFTLTWALVSYVTLHLVGADNEAQGVKQCSGKVNQRERTKTGKEQTGLPSHNRIETEDKRRNDMQSGERNLWMWFVEA